MDTATEQHHDLRAAMVAELQHLGAVTTAEVRDAMAAVPRHLLVDAAPEALYAVDAAVPVKTGDGGELTSSVSSPQVQAALLEAARVAPGMRVLEIGSGGYGAALLDRLAGPGGHVTTLDIDPDVAASAAAGLRAAGHHRVTVLHHDATLHTPLPGGPYDRVVVTAGAWDVPAVWVDALAPDGLLVVPLRMRGTTRLLALRPVGGHLAATGGEPCGFVPVRGAGAVDGEVATVLHDVDGARCVLLTGDTVKTPKPGAGFRAGPRAEVWTGVTVGRADPTDTLDLFLACTLPGFGFLRGDRQAIAAVVGGGDPATGAAAVDENTLTCLVLRRQADGRSEIGVRAAGPGSAATAREAADLVRVWDRHHRRGLPPVFTVHPRDAPLQELPDQVEVLDKIHTRVTVGWPSGDPGYPPPPVEGRPRATAAEMAARAVIAHVLKTSTWLDDRQRQLLRMRFGVVNGVPRSRDEMCAHFGNLSHATVKMMEANLLGQMGIGHLKRHLSASRPYPARPDGTPMSNLMHIREELWWREPDDTWTNGHETASWFDLYDRINWARVSWRSQGQFDDSKITPEMLLHSGFGHRDPMMLAVAAERVEKLYLAGGEIPAAHARKYALGVVNACRPGDYLAGHILALVASALGTTPGTVAHQLSLVVSVD